MIPPSRSVYGRVHPGAPQVVGMAFILVLGGIYFGWKGPAVIALGMLLAFTCGLMVERYRP